MTHNSVSRNLSPVTHESVSRNLSPVTQDKRNVPTAYFVVTALALLHAE